MAGIKRNFIGGQWRDAGHAAENRNPADPGDLIGYYARGRAADADAVARAAVPGPGGREQGRMAMDFHSSGKAACVFAR